MSELEKLLENFPKDYLLIKDENNLWCITDSEQWQISEKEASINIGIILNQYKNESLINFLKRAILVINDTE